jgi:CRP-like cAMP-binding protein
MQAALRAPRRDLAAGELLFRQGDRALAIFHVERGRLRLVRHLADGGAVTLHVARTGDGLAEAALFSGGYHCDAVAEIDSSVAVIGKAALLAGFRRDPEASLAFAADLSRQVRGLRWQLELRNIKSARERLLAWLRLQADADGVVMLDRPWTAIATELGLSHEAVYRALAALTADRKLRRQHGRIQLR